MAAVSALRKQLQMVVGNFQVPASSSLSDGQHVITARSSYVAEYQSDDSEELLIVVDATAPSFISGSVANSIAQQTGANQRVYNAITPDASDVTYALEIDNDDDADLFSLNPLSGQVRLKSDPDFDSQSSYSLQLLLPTRQVIVAISLSH